MQKNNLLSLLDLVYEGVLDNQHWRSFLRELNQEMCATSTRLIVEPISAPTKAYVLNQGGDERTIAVYDQGMHIHDPFVNLPDGELILLRELIDMEEWKETDFYKLCIEPSGLYFFMGIDLRFSDNMRFKLRIARTKAQKQFNDEDKQDCLHLARHIQRALRIKESAGYSEQELGAHRDALARMAVGTIVLSAEGDVLSVNETASRILERNDGFSLKNNRLSFTSSSTRTEYHDALQALGKPQLSPGVAKAIRLERPHAGSSIGIALKPLRLDSNELNADVTPRIVAYLNDTETKFEADVSALQELFELTPTESKLCLRLVNNYTLDTAAEELGMKRNTAKAHLRAIFIKVGVSRQSQLVTTIINSVAKLAN